MKKFVSIIAILLMLSLAACSNQDTPSAADNPSNTQTESNTMLDAGVWPVNEYTEGLPVPSGTVGWAMLDTEHENCSISIVDISETDYNDYLELLKQEGFSIIEEVSEEIEGQDYVSIGTLLSNGEKGLSISYIPDNFTIYISFLKIMKIKMIKSPDRRVLCPICGNKTRTKIRPDTILENFPLFCPKCKQETLISAKDLNVAVIPQQIAESAGAVNGQDERAKARR